MLKQNVVRSKNVKIKCRKFSTLQKCKIKMQRKIVFYSTTSVYNQPHRSTQPGHPFVIGTVSTSKSWAVNRLTMALAPYQWSRSIMTHLHHCRPDKSCIPCRRLRVSFIGDKIVVNAALRQHVSTCFWI